MDEGVDNLERGKAESIEKTESDINSSKKMENVDNIARFTLLKTRKTLKRLSAR